MYTVAVADIIGKHIQDKAKDIATKFGKHHKSNWGTDGGEHIYELKHETLYIRYEKWVNNQFEEIEIKYNDVLVFQYRFLDSKDIILQEYIEGEWEDKITKIYDTQSLPKVPSNYSSTWLSRFITWWRNVAIYGDYI
jgi:hypothetical protein